MRQISLFALFFSLVSPLFGFEVVGVAKLNYKALEASLGGQKNELLEESTYFFTIEDSGELSFYIYHRPLNPALFPAHAAQSEEFANREFIATEGGYFENDAQSLHIEKNAKELLAFYKKLPKEPLYILAKGSRILQALDKSPDFAKDAKEMPCIARFIVEDIESLELKAATEGDPLRLITVVKAHKGSALGRYFNQRLRGVDKEFLGSISKKNAAIYGYSNTNIPAFLEYRRAYAKFKCESASASETLPGSEKLQALYDGPMAFILDNNFNIFIDAAGSFSLTQTDELLAEYDDASLKSGGNLTKTARSFETENGYPVWETISNGQSHNFFTALHRGDIVFGMAPKEEFASFINTLDAPIAKSESLYEAFNHYPTVCAQFFIYPKTLYAATGKLLPFELPKAAFTDEPVYIAASQSQDKMGLTVDIPRANLNAGKELATTLSKIYMTLRMLETQQELERTKEELESLKAKEPKSQPNP